MKAPKLPETPDPYVVSDAQTQANQANAAYNNAITHGNTTTPYGTQTYTPRVDPVTGATVYDQTITVDQAVQDTINAQNQQDLALANTGTKMLGQVDALMGTPLDTSGLPQVTGAPQTQQLQSAPGLGLLSGAAGQVDSFGNSGPGIQGTLDTSGLSSLFGANDLLGARKQVQDALYQQQAAYLDPQYQQQDQQLRSEIANKGIAEGSEAWRNLMDNYNRARSFDYSNARNSAITGGGEEMSRLAGIALGNRGQLYNEALGAGNFRNAAQAQAFNEDLTRAGFGNQARLTNAQFGNDAILGNNASAMDAANFNNAAIAGNNAQALQSAGFNNTAAAQALAQAMAIRSQPLNELNALRSASQVSVPQFQNAQNAQAANTDVAGNIWNAYNANSQAAQLKASAQNGLMNGLFGLGSAALGNTSLFGKLL